MVLEGFTLNGSMANAITDLPSGMVFSGAVYSLLVAAIASFVASLLIVATQAWHGKLSLDNDVTGIQKCHKTPVPRVGGIALLFGMLAVLLLESLEYVHVTNHTHLDAFIKLLIAGMPAFAAGLLEDLTKKVSVTARLIATITSAVLASMLLGAYLPRLDVWGLDDLLQLAPFAVVVTAIAVAGVANSINIIDGFHGVAGSTVVIILAGLGYLAWQQGDEFLTKIAFLGLGATLGFLLVNYPSGRLFMGDGGAYFLGFWLAEVAVLLVLRNPAVNAWQVLAVCAYPIIEVLYSIYRRTVIRKVSPGAPDRLHLHTLVHRRLVYRIVAARADQPWIRNAAVACVLASWIATTTFIAVAVGGTIAAAIGIVVMEVLLYMAVYARLVRGHWSLHRRPHMEIHGEPLGKLSMRKSR